MGVFRMLQVGLKCILQEFQECVKNISRMVDVSTMVCGV